MGSPGATLGFRNVAPVRCQMGVMATWCGRSRPPWLASRLHGWPAAVVSGGMSCATLPCLNQTGAGYCATFPRGFQEGFCRMGRMTPARGHTRGRNRGDSKGKEAVGSGSGSSAPGPGPARVVGSGRRLRSSARVIGAGAGAGAGSPTPAWQPAKEEPGQPGSQPRKLSV